MLFAIFFQTQLIIALATLPTNTLDAVIPTGGYTTPLIVHNSGDMIGHYLNDVLTTDVAVTTGAGFSD